MKVLIIILTIAVALLSLVAGAAKVMLVPQEVEFLTAQGLTHSMIYLFGGVQILAGLLIAMAKTRSVGALLALLGFLVSSVLIFNSGNNAFGAVSLLPALAAGFVAYLGFSAKKK